MESYILKHESIKLSKRNYYKKNAEEQKLKSLRVYYIKHLQNSDLDETTKQKYENKLNELNEKISEFESSRLPKTETSEHSLTSLRSYYCKQMKQPDLSEEKKQTILAKISEINQKILQIQLKEKNVEELNKIKIDLENKIQSLDQMKEKYTAKLQEINLKLEGVNN